MGKSQRYQAAVDGQERRVFSLADAEKRHTLWCPESEYRPFTCAQDSWGLSGDVFVRSFCSHLTGAFIFTILGEFYGSFFYFYH